MPSVLSPRVEEGSVHGSGHKGAILSISAWLAFAYVARYEGESDSETYFFGIFTFRIDCPDKGKDQTIHFSCLFGLAYVRYAE